MNLADAIALFCSRNEAQTGSPLDLLKKCPYAKRELSDLDPNGLRAFLSRWCVENATTAFHATPSDAQSSATGFAVESGDPYTRDIQSLVDELSEFISWCLTVDEFTAASECQSVLRELRSSLPRALEIGARLAQAHTEASGAFEFPEFLSSFEEGGRTHYDLDGIVSSTAEAPRVLEGYFRIISVDECLVDAEELITEQRIGPIVFPASVAPLLAPDYAINLLLIRSGDRWEIKGCGLAYPPGAFANG